MKPALKRILIITLFTAGCLTLSYPFVSNWLAARRQTKIIRSYNESIISLSPERIQQEIEKAQEYNDIITGRKIRDPFIPGSGAGIPGEYNSVMNIEGIMGSVKIPKISVSLPIYHGVSEQILKKGAGHLEGTAIPIGGEGNHAVITGHRGLPSAKLFSDLDQLEIGDVFYIQVLDQTLAYQIDQIKVVEPDITDDLYPVPGKDLVTMITCTPYAINSHRLLIRGTRIPYQEEALKTEVVILRWQWALLIITIALVISGSIYFLLRRRRRR